MSKTNGVSEHVCPSPPPLDAMPPLPFHSFLLYHGHLLVIPYDIRDAVINRLLGSCQKRAFGKVQKTKRLSKHICPYISSPPPSCCHAGGIIVFQFQFVCTLAPPLSGGHFLSILGTFTILLRITLFFYKNKVYKNIKSFRCSII